MPSTRQRNNRPSKYIVQPTVKLVTVSVPEAMITHATGLGYIRKAHTFIRKVYGQIVTKRVSRFANEEPMERSFHTIGRPRGLNMGNHNTKGDLQVYDIFRQLRNTEEQRYDAQYNRAMLRDRKKRGITGKQPMFTCKDQYRARRIERLKQAS